MTNNERPIIIKKVKKVVHGGHHGGAWKVAYADFVTAMMALFLVLWLVTSLSKETKDGVSQYYKNHSIFDGVGAIDSQWKSATSRNTISDNVIVIDGGKKTEGKSSEEILNNLEAVIMEQLSEVGDQILITNTGEDGIRIELSENEHSSMFESGKAILSSKGKEIIKVISKELSDLPNDIHIEGHTDREPYPGTNYTNWELAADRANAARRELVYNGVNEEKVVKVTSFADHVPLKINDPYNPINRRVSILVVKMTPTMTQREKKPTPESKTGS